MQYLNQVSKLHNKYAHKIFFTVHKLHYMVDVSDVSTVTFTKSALEPWQNGYGFGTLISFKSGMDEIFIPHLGGVEGPDGELGRAKEIHNRIVKHLSEAI